MKLPKNLTIEQIADGAKRTMFGMENVGFCLSCGEEQGGCEPDAGEYKCESCGMPTVYGAGELLIMLC